MPFQTSDPRAFLDFYVHEPCVKENTFIDEHPDRSFPPSLAETIHLLPAPFFESTATECSAPETQVEQAVVRMYWKAWDLAFRNLRRVLAGNGFIAPFIDTAFNDCLFMWDSCFILLFARYGDAAFSFQRTLDNLYAKQHPDGFLCREIQEWDGQDRFHRHDPTSTGPDILAWCEWNHYLTHRDNDRLAKVFPVLLGYHRWLARHRRWPDGSYWSTGLACGMDNQPRTQPGDSPWVSHSNTAWVDATCQAVLSAQLLLKLAGELGPAASDRPELAELRSEIAHLTAYINDNMWDEARGFYADRRLGSACAQMRHEGQAGTATATATVGKAATTAGQATSAASASLSQQQPCSCASDLSDTMTIGAYWALLADVVPQDRLAQFLRPLDQPQHFNTPCRPASLSKSHPLFDSPRGGYWLGGVWPSTTYMVLRGLTHVGQHDLAADIGANWLTNCAMAFDRTGTIWENMAPDLVGEQGDPAKGDFVGWGGLVVAVLLEYYMGLRADVPGGTLTWDIRSTTGYGVLRYPFGHNGVVHLQVASRASLDEIPTLHVSSTVPIRLVVQWGKGMTTQGGVEPDRSGVSPGPKFERVVQLSPNMQISEAAAPPVCVPPHKHGVPPFGPGQVAESTGHVPLPSINAHAGQGQATGQPQQQQQMFVTAAKPTTVPVPIPVPVAIPGSVSWPAIPGQAPGAAEAGPSAAVQDKASAAGGHPTVRRTLSNSWMRVSGTKPSESPRAAAYRVELE